MRRKGHTGQAVQTGLAEGHQAEKWSVHDRDAGVPKFFVNSTQNDLAFFVLNAEGRQPQHGMDVVDARVGRVEQVGRLGRVLPCYDPPHAAGLLDAVRFAAVEDLDIGQRRQLLQKPALKHLRIVGVLGRQEGAVTQAGVKVFFRRYIVTAYLSRCAEPAELRRVRP